MDPEVAVPTNISVTEFILERFRGNEARVGLIDGETGEQWTFGQCAQYIHAIGSAFARRGFNKGNIVVIIAPNGLEHVTALFAVQAIGGIVSGINPVYTTGEIRDQVQDSNASYIVSHHTILPKVQEAVKKCPNVKEVFVIGKVNGFTSIGDMRADDGSCYPSVKIDAMTDLVLLPYSSGTTGRAKGVMLTHWNVMAQVHMFCNYEGYRIVEERKTVFPAFPYYHIGGYSFCASLLYQCWTAVVKEKFEFEPILRMVEKYKIESLSLPPPVLLRLAKDHVVDNYNLSSVESILSGAAPIGGIVQDEIYRRLKVQHVRQSYGMTEVGGLTHISRTDCQPVYGSAGAAHPFVQCKIMDLSTGKEIVELERSGELWMRSPGVMAGYWKQPAKTADILDKDWWIHTERVAPIKRLRGGVHFRDIIPKNPSGKFLRRKIRDEVKQEINGKSKL